MTSPEKREAMLSEAQERSNRAKELLAKFEALRKEALQFVPVGSIFLPKRSREVKEQWKAVLERLKTVAAEYGACKQRFDWEDQLAKRAEEERKKKEADAEKQRKVQEYTQRAVLWLQEHGKKLGEDFNLNNAVAEAEQLAFDQEVARLTLCGELHSFAGDDNCENCGGWDGVSRRCECGNRRVSWTTGWGHSFEKPMVYAEAY